MAKKALLIGINYPGTAVELRGCVNDVRRMQKCLIDRYGFSNKDITVLIDTDKTSIQPTGKNIREALKKLIAEGEPGDVLVFHYSGHGTRLPTEEGLFDATDYDECITPCDMNLITGMCPFFVRVLISCVLEYSVLEKQSTLPSNVEQTVTFLFDIFDSP